jgi:hypothetical protein
MKELTLARRGRRLRQPPLHARPRAARRRFAESQRRMASELLSGKRVLLLPPTTIAPRSSMWAVPPTLAAAIADATLAKRTPPASA